MSYPAHVSKQGTDRFAPGNGKQSGSQAADPLAAPTGPTATFVRDNTAVSPAGKRSGTETRRAGEGHPNTLSQMTEPSVRQASKSRRVTP